MNEIEPANPLGERGLVRLRLDIGYDGTDFAGWGVQPALRTVQDVVESALSTLFRVKGLRLIVAGRTDAGVHAAGQVAHCDLAEASWLRWSDKALRRLAGLLPPDVRIYSIQPVTKYFDARFGALWRRYLYRISDSDYGTEPLRRYDTANWRRTLDNDVMHSAAQHLLGLNDFSAFCRARPTSTTIRELQQLDVVRDDRIIEVRVQADAFCHAMVRSLVGGLASVGDGSQPVEWLTSLLMLGKRCDELTVAPARGLTLIEIGYPREDELASRAGLTRTRRVAQA
jgi:tRNA pseudouridine38-40 synthase